MMVHVHSRNVILYDTKMYNIMLQNGTIQLFDWNLGKIFHQQHNNTTTTTITTTTRDDQEEELQLPSQKYNHVSPPRYPTVHEHDVRKVGKRIREFVKHQKKKQSKQHGAHQPNNTAVVSPDDLELLHDLYHVMESSSSSKTPPTFQWILDHHAYFAIHKNESCHLIW